MIAFGKHAAYLRGIVELDNHLKNLLRELGYAINDTVSESDRILGAIAGVRAHGYEIVLKLDATIVIARRNPEKAHDAAASDKRFLESLRIQADPDQFPIREEKK